MALHLQCGMQRPMRMPVRERAKNCHQLILWMYQMIEAGGGVTTEAESCREPIQHGVLPCLAGGEVFVMDGTYQLTCCTVPPALARELLSCELLVILAAAAAGFFYQLYSTQNTDINEITHSRHGQDLHVLHSQSGFFFVCYSARQQRF
jgi:hypothetical protein